MSRRRILERHRHSLTEIRNIMNSMKALAHMEVRKLDRFLDAQRKVVRSIEEVAADFLNFNYETLPEVEPLVEAYLIVGTERGFCGDFNRALLTHLDSALHTRSSVPAVLIVVGRKLHTLLEKDGRVSARVEGASTVEEITTVFDRVVRELSVLQKKHGVLGLCTLFHNGEMGIETRRLLPPFQQRLDSPPKYSDPPVLNLEPEDFLVELTDHYLFAALHEVLYISLMTENHRRVTHLEGAVQHLEDESTALERRCNTLRQEEIIEEIEVILLSATGITEH